MSNVTPGDWVALRRSECFDRDALMRKFKKYLARAKKLSIEGNRERVTRRTNGGGHALSSRLLPNLFGGKQTHGGGDFNVESRKKGHAVVNHR